MAEALTVQVTLAQLEQLKNNQRRLSDVLTILNKMENCGMACDVIRQSAENAITQMQAVEREFFTPPPKV
jgi:hypothetical protein